MLLLRGILMIAKLVEVVMVVAVLRVEIMIMMVGFGLKKILDGFRF